MKLKKSVRASDKEEMGAQQLEHLAPAGTHRIYSFFQSLENNKQIQKRKKKKRENVFIQAHVQKNIFF